MTHPAKRKGDKYELEAARWLAELTEQMACLLREATTPTLPSGFYQ